MGGRLVSGEMGMAGGGMGGERGSSKRAGMVAVSVVDSFNRVSKFVTARPTVRGNAGFDVNNLCDCCFLVCLVSTSRHNCGMRQSETAH